MIASREDQSCTIVRFQNAYFPDYVFHSNDFLATFLPFYSLEWSFL